MSPRVLAVLLLLLAATAAPGLPRPAAWPSKEAVLVFHECALPPATPNEKPIDFAATPFPASALKGYAPDVPVEEILKPESRNRYALRVTVLDGFTVMRDNRGEARLRTDLPAVPTDTVKKLIAVEQMRLAHDITILELTMSRLEEVAGLKAKESKRWQAHYDYAVAQVKLRLAFLNEYNLALAHVRTDLLPNLDPAKGQTGYRLAWAEKMQSNKSVRELADEARDRFRAITADHPNTPWAALASRSNNTPIGLHWEPAGEKK
jgi:hypothetical protein